MIDVSCFTPSAHALNRYGQRIYGPAHDLKVTDSLLHSQNFRRAITADLYDHMTRAERIDFYHPEFPTQEVYRLDNCVIFVRDLTVITVQRHDCIALERGTVVD